MYYVYNITQSDNSLLRAIDCITKLSCQARETFLQLLQLFGQIDPRYNQNNIGYYCLPLWLQDSKKLTWNLLVYVLLLASFHSWYILYRLVGDKRHQWYGLTQCWTLHATILTCQARCPLVW